MCDVGMWWLCDEDMWWLWVAEERTDLGDEAGVVWGVLEHGGAHVHRHVVVLGCQGNVVTATQALHTPIRHDGGRTVVIVQHSCANLHMRIHANMVTSLCAFMLI